MNTKLKASLSLDLDNLWCYQRSFGIEQWQSYSSFIPDLLPRALSFLKQRELKATFFVVGQDLLDKDNHLAIKSITNEAFEIGNHSFHHHTGLHLQPLSEIESELKRTHQLIEDVSSQTPIGFRGPAFGISDNLLQALINLNYQYDASTLRNSAGALARSYHQKRASEQAQLAVEEQSLYGSLHDAWQTMRPFMWKNKKEKLLEVPVTTMPVLRLPFHGTYLHYLADYSEGLALLYLQLALKLCKLRNVAPSFLLHLTDFVGADCVHDLRFLPGMKRTTERKIDFMSKVMNCFQQDYEMLSIGEFVQSLSLEELPCKTAQQGMKS